ncbi:general stress protein [Paenibacillus harenae]|uniref:general stress protein n=1 Tax=Paenibacillus harenae TaxID=306543 RepID=UPI0004292436|nr:general stress protein [Paenibacillus harenae]
MTRKIGIFDTEQQAINAIQQLEQAGFVQGELQVLAKDSEHSRRIEAESGVHADELRELEDTSDERQGLGRMGMATAAGFGTPGATAAYGITGYGTSVLFGGVFPSVAAALFNGNEHDAALHSLGLDDDEAQLCHQALQNGSVIVIARTDESKSLLDKEDGPDLSRLSKAEAIFRQYNAKAIASGV